MPFSLHRRLVLSNVSSREKSLRLRRVILSLADVGLSVGWLQGLSEVISHMLGGESQSFDFSIENQLLRCPLEKFFRITGLNTVR